MPLPASLQKLGLVPASQMANKKFRRLMLGTDGLTNTGKTEFLFSLPGPKVILPMDTSYDSVFDNPTPPAWRNLDDAVMDNIKCINVAQVASGSEYAEYFKAYRKRLYELLLVPEIRAIAIDGDSDTWEAQLLAEFGRLTQIHPLSYPMVDGMRRYMIKKCWESGKIIVGTNKLKDKYEDVLDDDGNVMKDDKGKNIQRKVAGEYKRQGFRDQDYLWQIQIRHMYRPGGKIDLSALPPAQRLKAVREGKDKAGPEWGIRIMKCKPNTKLEGDELWGEHCNFLSLVQHIYPQVPPEDWGF